MQYSLAKPTSPLGGSPVLSCCRVLGLIGLIELMLHQSAHSLLELGDNAVKSHSRALHVASSACCLRTMRNDPW